jgi:hypothetical protein
MGHIISTRQDANADSPLSAIFLFTLFSTLIPCPCLRRPSVMDVISTFSAVVPAEAAKAALNLSCLSWSKFA